MPFTMTIRVGDQLVEHLKQRRDRLFGQVAQTMLERMEEAVVMAKTTVPVRTGALQSAIQILDFDPTVPMIKAGVGIAGQGFVKSFFSGPPGPQDLPEILKSPGDREFGWRWGNTSGAGHGYYLPQSEFHERKIVIDERLKTYWDLDPEACDKLTRFVVAHEFEHKHITETGYSSTWTWGQRVSGSYYIDENQRDKEELLADLGAYELTGISRRDRDYYDKRFERELAAYLATHGEEQDELNRIVEGIKRRTTPGYSPPEHIARSLVTSMAQWTNPLEYAKYIEFGTSLMAARPFWRPAVWEAFFRMLEDFKALNRGEDIS